MAKTPVTMKVDGYKDREVMMVNYEFEQETDVEGQMSGIPRGGKITVRVKALNDGTPDLLEIVVDHHYLTVLVTVYLHCYWSLCHNSFPFFNF